MKRNYWKGYALVVTGLLAFSVGNSIVPAEAGPEPHLSIARTRLDGAIKQLEKAKGEFGGHRVKAINLTKQAIEEVDEALRFRPPSDKPQPQPPSAPPAPGGNAPKGPKTEKVPNPK